MECLVGMFILVGFYGAYCVLTKFKIIDEGY